MTHASLKDSRTRTEEEIPRLHIDFSSVLLPRPGPKRDSAKVFELSICLSIYIHILTDRCTYMYICMHTCVWCFLVSADSTTAYSREPLRSSCDPRRSLDLTRSHAQPEDQLVARKHGFQLVSSPTRIFQGSHVLGFALNNDLIRKP